MSILAFRESIKTTVEGTLKTLAKVYTHGGRFDLDELKRWAVQAPCVVIAPLGIRAAYIEGGQSVADVQWGIFTVTRDLKTTTRDAAALTLVEGVLSLVKSDQRWGSDDAHAVEDVRGENLFTGKLDAQGIAIWGISWKQGIDINVFDVNALDDFLLYESTIQLSDDEDVPTSIDDVTLEAP